MNDKERAHIHTSSHLYNMDKYMRCILSHSTRVSLEMVRRCLHRIMDHLFVNVSTRFELVSWPTGCMLQDNGGV